MTNKAIQKEESKYNSVETWFDMYCFKTDSIKKVKLLTSQPWNHPSAYTITSALKTNSLTQDTIKKKNKKQEKEQKTKKGDICQLQLLKMF